MRLEGTRGQEKRPGTGFRVHVKAGVKAGCRSRVGRGHRANVSDRRSSEGLDTRQGAEHEDYLGCSPQRLCC